MHCISCRTVKVLSSNVIRWNNPYLTFWWYHKFGRLSHQKCFFFCAKTWFNKWISEHSLLHQLDYAFNGTDTLVLMEGTPNIPVVEVVVLYDPLFGHFHGESSERWNGNCAYLFSKFCLLMDSVVAHIDCWNKFWRKCSNQHGHCKTFYLFEPFWPGKWELNSSSETEFLF